MTASDTTGGGARFHDAGRIRAKTKGPAGCSVFPFMRAISTLLCLIGLTGPVFCGSSVLFIAGPKSHAPGAHEHPAGCALLAKHLESSGLGLSVAVSQGWPQDAEAAAAADTIVIYGDGLDAHPAKNHIAELRQRHEAGKGLAVIHFALEPSGPEMAKLFDDALGGRFEAGWSVNPVWDMKAPLLAEHPVTRGVKRFEIEEEFYFHLRFRDDAVHLLRSLPPADALGDDGPRSGNPAVRKAIADKVPQTLAWAVANETGSRGFGFTGGHFHHHWANDSFRKLVLNGIVWTAGVEVPENGVVGTVAAEPAYQTIDEAIAKGDLDDVKLQVKLHPERALKGGKTNSRPPLEQAILRKKEDIALFLIGNGSDVNIADRSNRTPLHLAVERNLPKVLEALLKTGAKPDLLDRGGWTPLHNAAAKDQPESIKALLAGGANPMTLSQLGGTPLHEAAASGGPEVIRLLLEAKVDPTVKSKEGVTALDLARKYKNEEAVEILEGL